MEMASPFVLHIKMTKWRGFAKLSKNAFLAAMQLYMSLCHRNQEGKKAKKIRNQECSKQPENHGGWSVTTIWVWQECQWAWQVGMCMTLSVQPCTLNVEPGQRMAIDFRYGLHAFITIFFFTFCQLMANFLLTFSQFFFEFFVNFFPTFHQPFSTFCLFISSPFFILLPT